MPFDNYHIGLRGFAPPLMDPYSPRPSIDNNEPAAAVNQSEPAMIYQPNVHGTVEQFEISHDFRQFASEMRETLGNFCEFVGQHCPRDAEVMQSTLRKFEDRLLNLEVLYYSNSRVAFYAEGKRTFDLLHRLIKNDSIPLDLRVSAVRNVIGELGVCGPGMIPKLVNEVNRLCNGNAGLLATSWQCKHDMLEQQIQSYIQVNRHCAPGYEIHEYVAFTNYASDRLGLETREDPFAPRDVSLTQLEECAKQVEDSINPSSLALALAERYHETYIDRLCQETQLTREELISGTAYDEVILLMADRVVNELARAYGSDTVRHRSPSVLAFDDDSGEIRVPTGLTLLARDILRAQVTAGYVEPQSQYTEGELLIGWTQPGAAFQAQIRHSDETLVWGTVGGQAERLTVEHLTHVPPEFLNKLQQDQPKLAALLARTVINHEPADTLSTLPPLWLQPELCASFGAIVNCGVRGQDSVIRRPAVEEPVCP
ncbi:hypothetical protein, partial [Burkholderia ubonensis]|uniref:hypothetical protein n=1 Tax=Burkholderia ubonensis TaxID=101571 RepID=UPI000A9248CC